MWGAEGGGPVNGGLGGGSEASVSLLSSLDAPLGLEGAVPHPTHFPNLGKVWHPRKREGIQAIFGVLTGGFSFNFERQQHVATSETTSLTRRH